MAVFAVVTVPASAREEAPRPRVVAATLSTPDDAGARQLAITLAPSAEMPLRIMRSAEGLEIRLPFADPAYQPRVTGEGLAAVTEGEGMALMIAGAGDMVLRRRTDDDAAQLALTLHRPGVAPPPGPRDVPLPPARPARAEDDVFTVMLDPGHGGFDPGATVDGFVEKRLTLFFARRLAARINARPGMRALLTRGGDRFLPLGERQRMAVAAGADVFLSIHADTVTVGDASGLSVYTLEPEAREEAAASITGEAPRDEILRGVNLEGQGDDVTRILVDLAQRRSAGESEHLAQTILDTLRPDFTLLPTRPHRRGNFRVLRTADVPAVLIELGFLSSEIDRDRLSDRRWQGDVAARIADAIELWHHSLATKRGDR